MDQGRRRGEHFGIEVGAWPPQLEEFLLLVHQAHFQDKGEISKVHDVIENHFADMLARQEQACRSLGTKQL